MTAKCLTSIRKVLPGSRTILSTWPDQDFTGLDYDELVTSEDPGSNIVAYRSNGTPIIQNFNRQIVSSREGLKRVSTRYAMKLRADNFLISDRFKELQQAFPERCDRYRFLTQRVIVNNTFTREYAKGLPVAFHACDFFYFGLSDDLLDLWDLELFEDFPFDSERRGQKQHLGAPRFPPDATQRLWLRFLNKHLDSPIELQHAHDVTDGKKRVSDICYANNLIIGSPEIIGLGLPSKFIGAERAASRASLLSYMDHTSWQRLYKRYCGPGYPIPRERSYAARLYLERLIRLGGKRLEANLRLLKNRLRHSHGGENPA